eukprot:TRINITY_DN121758_c0_g1_i1.p1 TRINITY_DN121758_c0_g1~~TRINITY_DN121758_c0_g1_i1.p1  ORF type:complete len:468 (+),score=106.16 TRINITY_DN121758_c0_g1_i1:64-1404(+)
MSDLERVQPLEDMADSTSVAGGLALASRAVARAAMRRTARSAALVAVVVAGCCVAGFSAPSWAAPNTLGSAQRAQGSWGLLSSKGRPALSSSAVPAAEASASEARSSVSYAPGVAAAAVSGAVAAVQRLTGHRIRAPVKKASSPFAEIAFGLAVLGSVREVVRTWGSATASFQIRDELFQEMAVAQTYENSVWPWIQTGGVALVVSLCMIFGVKKFIKSMKEWEEEQEMKEMGQLGEDAAFLMSTPVSATPIEQKLKKIAKSKTPVYWKVIAWVADKSLLLRLGACVGYLLPLLNVLDFGQISVSLFPYPLGIAPTAPLVDFLMVTCKLNYLYNAYIKSGYYFLIVWFLFIQLTVRNKAAPFYLRFHSSQAILLSMLLGVPQQIFFAVLNPWESGLLIQSFMYYSMCSLFFFILVLVAWCCINALCKKTMKMPLVSEAAVMWAGRP